MIDWILTRIPGRWQEIAEFALAPIAWIPRLQDVIVDFFLHSSSVDIAVLKCLFLLFPGFLVVAAIWCTQLSVYTLPFRSRRHLFLSALLLTWWDAARIVWLYWAGVVRAAIVLVGWVFALTHLAVKLLVDTLRQVALMPFSVSGRAGTRYFQPGVPWVAFLVLVSWCLLEGTIFTSTLLPAVSKTLAGLSGTDDVSTATRPTLWILLVLLSMGSFACIQAFTDALKTRERKFLVQLVLVELFVMTFEVMFLYRPLVDAITPWLGQQAGDRFRPAVAVALGTFGWIGVRGMTWFLFGRYGTPSLLAFISRQPLVGTDLTGTGEVVRSEPTPWRASVDDFMREIAGLHERGDQLLEYLALPAIHVIAVAVNFAMVLIASRPVFSLPFRGIRDAMDTKEWLAALPLEPSKGAGL
jgi:hypothetical protein